MIEVNCSASLVSKAALPTARRPPRPSPAESRLVNISSVAGRVPLGQRRLQRTKHGVGPFSESLRQEVTGRHVRVSLSSRRGPTELVSHNRLRSRSSSKGAWARSAPRARRHRRRDLLRRHPRPPRRDQQVLIRPTEQEG